LRANFVSQNSEWDFGFGGVQKGQRCQKHPLTKMATLLPVEAIAGIAGLAKQFTQPELGLGVAADVPLH
jgi:hypothetical protein